MILKKVEYAILAEVLVQWLCDARRRWEHLDQLYSELFYTEARLARLLHATGELSVTALKRVWDDIDQRAGEYNFRCLDRWLIDNCLSKLSRKLRHAVRNAEVSHES